MKKLQVGFFISLLLVVFAVTLFILIPFITSLALAFMAAITIRPINRWFLYKTGGRRSFSATLSVIFTIVVILVPLTILVQQVTVEAYSFYADVRTGQLGGFDTIIETVLEPIHKVFPNFNPDIDGYINSISTSIFNNATSIFSGAASISLALFIAFISLFYMLRDGHKFKKVLVNLSPLADSYDTEIIDRIERAVSSVVRGSLLTALIKGMTAGLAFAFFGVPHALLWAAVTVIVSLIPLLGSGITIVPATLYLLAMGSIGPAIGLILWGALVVGLVDNVLMPLVIGKGSVIHPLLVLLSALGGISLFGPIGLFLGPLVIAFLSALIEIYKLIILQKEHKTAGVI